MDKMSIYNKLPVWGQNLACYAEGRRIQGTRYSKDFWKYLEEYESHNNWSYEQLCDYRDARLRKMIHHCYDTVPYYTMLFNEGGINPDTIKTIDDLKLLPILTKDIVNAGPKAFLSSAIPRKDMVTAHTSGTTGSGFIFQTTQKAICEQWAVWWRYRKRNGIQFGTWAANFGTRLVVPIEQNSPPFWRYNAACHQIYFSAFHESPENLCFYAEEIRNKKIAWIHGYPSLITALATYMLDNRISFENQVKFVSIGAESLLDNQRRAIGEAFGVQPIQHYGLSEGVANFSEQPDKRIIVDEDFSAVEFIPSSVDSNEIIGSNLTNFAMPLLRWDTKDTATVTETAFGRVVTSIDGRIEDYVVLPNGRRIGKLDSVFKDTINLQEVQIHQNADYSIVVNVVKRNNNIENDILLARTMLNELLGESVEIDFRLVDSLQKSTTGKLRFIVSDVKSGQVEKEDHGTDN